MPYKDPAKQREYNNAWTRRRQARIREWLDAYCDALTAMR